MTSGLRYHLVPKLPSWQRFAMWVVIFGVLSVFGLPASPASAHAVLVSANPGQGAVIDRLPSAVTLVFSETVTPVEGRTQVIDPTGARADQDQAKAQGVTLIIPLRAVPGTGTFLVSYRVISADNHPIAGAYTFAVGAPSPGGPPSLNDAAQTASTFVVTAFPVARWIGYIGLALLVGAVLVLNLFWPRRLDRRALVRSIWIGAAMVAAGTVGEILLQAPYTRGGSISEVRWADLAAVVASQYGAAHLVRLGVLGAAMLLIRPMIRGKAWGADAVLLAVLGTIAIGSWSVPGHPGSSAVPLVTTTADMIHLAAMSVWLGSTFILVALLLRWANAAELGAIIPIWSRWAAYAIGILVLTGIAQALIQVGSLELLFSTSYGWLLVTKIALVGGVLGAAALSRRVVASVTAAETAAARKLRWWVAAEATFAVLVIAVTSVLVQTPPARTPGPIAATSTLQQVILRDPLFILTADVTPALPGSNEVHMYATTPNGQPANVKEWQVTAALPEQNIEAITATVLPLTPDHATAQIGLPSAGRWKFTFKLRTTEVDQSTVTAEIVVAG